MRNARCQASAGASAPRVLRSRDPTHDALAAFVNGQHEEPHDAVMAAAIACAMLPSAAPMRSQATPKRRRRRARSRQAVPERRRRHDVPGRSAARDASGCAHPAAAVPGPYETPPPLRDGQAGSSWVCRAARAGLRRRRPVRLMVKRGPLEGGPGRWSHRMARGQLDAPKTTGDCGDIDYAASASSRFNSAEQPVRPVRAVTGGRGDGSGMESTGLLRPGIAPTSPPLNLSLVSTATCTR